MVKILLTYFSVDKITLIFYRSNAEISSEPEDNNKMDPKDSDDRGGNRERVEGLWEDRTIRHDEDEESESSDKKLPENCTKITNTNPSDSSTHCEEKLQVKHGTTLISDSNSKSNEIDKKDKVNRVKEKVKHIHTKTKSMVKQFFHKKTVDVSDENIKNLAIVEAENVSSESESQIITNHTEQSSVNEIDCNSDKEVVSENVDLKPESPDVPLDYSCGNVQSEPSDLIDLRIRTKRDDSDIKCDEKNNQSQSSLETKISNSMCQNKISNALNKSSRMLTPEINEVKLDSSISKWIDSTNNQHDLGLKSTSVERKEIIVPKLKCHPFQNLIAAQGQMKSKSYPFSPFDNLLNLSMRQSNKLSFNQYLDKEKFKIIDNENESANKTLSDDDENMIDFDESSNEMKIVEDETELNEINKSDNNFRLVLNEDQDNLTKKMSSISFESASSESNDNMSLKSFDSISHSDKFLSGFRNFNPSFSKSLNTDDNSSQSSFTSQDGKGRSFGKGIDLHSPKSLKTLLNTKLRTYSPVDESDPTALRAMMNSSGSSKGRFWILYACCQFVYYHLSNHHSSAEKFIHIITLNIMFLSNQIFKVVNF